MKLFETIKMFGGIFLWIQIFIALVILILLVINTMDLFFRKELKYRKSENSINTIIFLGVFSAIWGIFAQIVGIVQALGSIIEAADISPQILIDGFRISFITALTGLGTLLFSAVGWYILKFRFHALTGKNTA
jgi:hypothetical protein